MATKNTGLWAIAERMEGCDGIDCASDLTWVAFSSREAAIASLEEDLLAQIDEGEDTDQDDVREIQEAIAELRSSTGDQGVEVGLCGYWLHQIVVRT